MAKEKVTVRYFSRSIHSAQLFTGLHKLRRRGAVSLRIEDHTTDSSYPYKTAITEVVYRGKVLAFDMLDGYNDIDAIRWFYERCDFYFKRSFSHTLNRLYGFSDLIFFPWGFNYHVSYIGNPCEGPADAVLKEIIKIIFGKETNCYFTTKIFEEKPVLKKRGIRILFLTRLWSISDSLNNELNNEREHINRQRIDLLRKLRECFKEDFYGGLECSKLSEKMAPDLCIPPELTRRKSYLRQMHQSDICIATTGLHNSIGWKMGEYIAASKGIVSEPLNYIVPGGFEAGINYLEFKSIDCCISSVRSLFEDPIRLYEMKLRNYYYYLSYLEPSHLISNCFHLIDTHI